LTAQPTARVSTYLDFLDKEYLAPFVAQGGAAVKLLVAADETVAGELAAGLAGLGDGFLHAAVDAAATRVHLVDQVFTAIARQLDWVGLAGSVVRTAFERCGFPPPVTGEGEPDLGITVVAKYHGVDGAELYRSVRRDLEQTVLKNGGLGHEFRVAMLRLCQERLGRGEVSPAERETILGWLRGERVPAGELRKLSLHTRVNRHNARSLLLSTTRWLRMAGGSGLVLWLDLTRLAVARRPVELINDERRGLPSYTALRLRVVDEVRDRHRVNPYATLVGIGMRVGGAA
jgi:hypothetical protein